MNVWLCMPSKRPPADAQPVVDRWVEMGYRVVVQRDKGDAALAHCLNVHRDYAGFAEAQNHLISTVMIADQYAWWFVCAGDDTWPDEDRYACHIAKECSDHFKHLVGVSADGSETALWPSTFGVMQPVGDRWGEGDRGMGKESEAHIDCVAGSPWIGREFARRMYGGRGPWFPDYYHMFDDEELQCVATKLGVFWQRKDITHLHKHWTRGLKIATEKDMPAFLVRANSPATWAKSKALFEARRVAGFPGHEPTI